MQHLLYLTNNTTLAPHLIVYMAASHHVMRYVGDKSKEELVVMLEQANEEATSFFTQSPPWGLGKDFSGKPSKAGKDTLEKLKTKLKVAALRVSHNPHATAHCPCTSQHAYAIVLAVVGEECSRWLCGCARQAKHPWGAEE